MRRPSEAGDELGAARARGLALAARASVAVALVCFFVGQSFEPHAADFKTFYSAGYAITHPGIPLYDTIALRENPFGEVFKLPPSAALYLAPLPLGTLQQARLIWRIVLVAAYVAAFTLLCRAFGVRALSTAWLLGLAAWCAFAPAQFSIGEGQWDPILLLLLALAAIGAASGRPLVAALPVAIAASVKLYPAIAALFFVGRRWWSALAVAALASGSLLLAGAIAAGPEETRVFLQQVLPASGATTAYPDNQALGGTLARLVTSDLKPFPLRGMPGVDLTIRLVAAIAVAACTWLVWRAPGRDPLERALQLSLFVPVSILVIPAAWSHYQTILLLPLFLLALDQARHRPRAWAGWLMLGVAFVLVALPNPAVIIGSDVERALWQRGRADGANLALQREFPDAWSRLILSYKTLGVALLLGLNAWRVARTPNRDPVAAGDPIAARTAGTVAGLAGASQRAAG